MTPNCLLYYITDRKAFAEDEATRRRHLLEKIAEAARAGVDYIQLRERDLSARELESLGREAVRVVRVAQPGMSEQSRTSLLINSRTDVALAVGAQGVHLRSEDISPREARTIWERCGTSGPAREVSPQVLTIGVSCHTSAEVTKAAVDNASFAAFAPVFEKKDAPGMPPVGLELLEQACRERIPVIALGGVTLGNARACLKAGAAGVAAIRLFQENEIRTIVKQLRG
ncbi:MAG TPA: thiamine phosphate synthase [Verrucomicrobiae bacterium]|nr:thiamine phosphate synthase [Verrucomicrobiae bacterium]